MKRSEAKKHGQSAATLTVCYPRQEMYPIKFHGFEIGGLSLTVEIPPGGDVQAVYDAAWSKLEVMAAKQFAAVLPDYLERVRKAAAATEEVRKAFKGQ